MLKIYIFILIQYVPLLKPQEKNLFWSKNMGSGQSGVPFSKNKSKELHGMRAGWRGTRYRKARKMGSTYMYMKQKSVSANNSLKGVSREFDPFFSSSH